jgi:hypothetical protein
VKDILSIIDKSTIDYENIMITGSLLDTGFNFNDVDVIVVNDDALNVKSIQDVIRGKLGIKSHIISLDSRILMKVLSTDQLYQMMLSRCIEKKRFIYKIKRDINYKILNLHLLKSKTLIEGFDLLDGNEKCYLIRNMIAILLCLQNKKIGKEKVDKEIMNSFNLKDVKEVKQNI